MLHIWKKHLQLNGESTPGLVIYLHANILILLMEQGDSGTAKGYSEWRQGKRWDKDCNYICLKYCRLDKKSF